MHNRIVRVFQNRQNTHMFLVIHNEVVGEYEVWWLSAGLMHVPRRVYNVGPITDPNPYFVRDDKGTIQRRYPGARQVVQAVTIARGLAAMDEPRMTEEVNRLGGLHVPA